MIVADGVKPTMIDVTPTPAHAAALLPQIRQLERSMAQDAGLGLPDWLKRLRATYDDTQRRTATPEEAPEGDCVMVPAMARILDSSDIAERLHVHVRTAQRHLSSMPGAFRVGRSWRISADDFERLGRSSEQRRVPA
jgi:hypothetical protein